MPFDTLERDSKRIRSNQIFATPTIDDICFIPSAVADDAWPFLTHYRQPYHHHLPPLPWKEGQVEEGQEGGVLFLADDCPPTPLETSSVDSEPTNDPQGIFSKFGISYTDVGINIKACLSSVSDLSTLIDAFSKLCTHPESPITPTADKACGTSTSSSSSGSAGSVILHRNRNFCTRPVNLTRREAGRLPYLPRISLHQIVDHCIHKYFSCWERYPPVLAKKEFMDWYNAHPSPTDTLIVNAICAFVFRHVVIYHNFHPDLKEDQEAFFFDRARELLAQSFDCPDRHTVVALLLMSRRGERSKQHHYAGMAMSCLQELCIYPRMSSETDDASDSFDKEMDTRLWWYAWATDFSLYSSGMMPKNTPQTRHPGQAVDLPKVFEQDIDETEMAVLAYEYCYALWKIQADIVEQLYDHDNATLTVDQLHAYDKQLLDVYSHLPPYLRLDSGFEYGHEELFLVCLRVNVEYNATRIILLKLFIPDVADENPSTFSLQVLNLCLATALRQLKALNTYFTVPTNTCFFDCDELWRASEIIATAMDIYTKTKSPVILHNIDMEEYTHALETAFHILKLSPDYKSKRKDWILLGEWLDAEINRHGGGQDHKQHRRQSTPNYFFASLKSSSLSPPQYIHPSLSSTISLQHPPPPQPQPHKQRYRRKPPPPPPAPQSDSAFVHFEPTNPRPSRSAYINSTKGQQARFRYFNPRKMNKFLFIDENPAF